MNLKLKVKSIIFLILIITIDMQAQSPVESITGIPSNNADNATGKQNAIWRNSVIAPQNSSFPNQQNWWSIFQTQFFDTRYDAQLAFGLNQQDLWLRYNYNENWKSWKKIILGDENGNLKNLGIGTTPVDAKLQIHGSNAHTSNLLLSANYENKFRWRFNTHDRGNAIDLDITASDYLDKEEVVLKLSRSNSGRPEFQLYNNSIVVNNNKIGLNVEHPNAQLVIGNNFGATISGTSGGNAVFGTNLALKQGGVDHNKFYTPYPHPGEYGYAAMNTSWGKIKFYTEQINTSSDGIIEPKVRMVINELGNVGIGTTTPDTKLTVKGDIHTQEVKVDLNGAVAPDYVFEEDYKLKSLQEVETYIEKEGHLPNIPSAAEMEKEGVNLKEMNLKLLEKIEELTLYIIEQNRKNMEQESRIQTLFNNNKEMKKSLDELYNYNHKK